ncbi:MAG: PAS domain-containing protein [Armatimonadetes bacterium]|nr:PAS domain-containing protein [Armatimonadota bacterium]
MKQPTPSFPLQRLAVGDARRPGVCGGGDRNNRHHRSGRWSVVLLLWSALLFLLPAIASGQHTATAVLSPTNPAERLWKIPHGYLGVAQVFGRTQLTRYNDSLRPTETTYSLLAIHDLQLTSPTADTLLLLAEESGRIALAVVPVKGKLEMRLLQRTSFPRCTRFLPGGQFAVGDSVVVAVSDGKVVMMQQGEILDAVQLPNGSQRLVVAQRSDEGLLLSAIANPNGVGDTAPPISATLPAASGGVRLLLAGPNQVALLQRGRPNRAILLDADLLVVNTTIDLPTAPTGVAQLTVDGATVPAIIFGTYPRPLMLPIAPNGAPQEFQWPLSQPFSSVAQSGGLIALVGTDSVALYDSTMQLIAVAPSGGAAAASLTVLSPIQILLSSAEGSRLITVDLTLPNWFSRHWGWLLPAAIGLIVLAAIVLVVRRYLFARNLYRNLVRLPNSGGVIVLSRSQRVRHLNDSARGMMEVDRYIPLGRHISEYVRGAEWGMLMAGLRRLFQQGESFEQKIDLRREGGIRSVSLRGRPLYGRLGAPAGYLLLMEDVTRTLEQERLVNWASVAHHIAHEMKTPLGAVTITAESLHHRLTSNGHDVEMMRSTQRIVRQSRRLREIVDDLLTVARTESLNRTWADVALLVTSLLQDVSDTIPQNVRIECTATGENFRAMVDVPQLTVAVRNVIDNAWQAIGSRADGAIHVRISESPEIVTIEISDNGIGMSQQTMEQLFQPFYTERPGGSGIGTVILKRVVEGHGGSVQVESRQGHGSRFILTILRT